VNKEENHQRAIEIARTIENEEKIISKLVIAETITVLKKKLPIKDIIKIYEVLGDFITVEDAHLFDKTFKQFVKYDGEISFFDAVYIVIMDEFNIHEIVSFDEDFDNKDRIVRIH
jgi:predicted nucleic acid-binding protein